MYSNEPLVPTHDFITFAGLSVTSLEPETLLLLGECYSKCKHLAGAPLKPFLAGELSTAYLARGALATTAIEGNTLTLKNAEDIIVTGSADVGQSRQYQEQEIRNVVEAIGQIHQAVIDGERIPITLDRLCELNALILRDVPDEPHVIPGQLRMEGINVTVGHYTAPFGRDVPMLAKEFEDWLRRMREISPDASEEWRFVTAFLSAVMAHLYIAWIHPFGNGNGRLARLVETQILAESGIVPIVSTQLLSNHFNLTRDAYYRSLNEARTSPARFIQYAIQGFVDGLREQIEQVKGQNLQIVWESFVHETFDRKGDHKTPEVRKRQIHLAMVLPSEKGTTPEDATNLSPKLIRAYATAGDRMPIRDLNELVRLGLARRVGKRKFKSRRELIQGFLPPVLN